MKRTLIAMVAALGLASSASAATLTIETDQATYNVNDTITVTMTLNTEAGDPAVLAVSADMSWNGAVGDGADQSSQSGALTAFGGLLPFSAPAASGCISDSTCRMLDQVAGLNPLPPDPGQTITATLQILAIGIGTLDLTTGPVFDVLGLGGATLGANASVAQVVPEPGTAAMVGLGLLGLASVGRRRD